MRKYLYDLATDRSQGFFAGLARSFLLLFSVIYGLIVRFLAFFHSLRARRLQTTVISIGNITLGGTGKTPLVEYIAGLLRNRGEKFAILTRGYKKGPGGTSDEALMLQDKLEGIPVIVNPDRIAAAREARDRYGASTVILDDGMQQWRIKKDLEIVVIDAVNPFGNKHILPRGILREPLSALRRADIFVLTKTDMVTYTVVLRDFLKRNYPKALVIESRHAPCALYVLGDKANTVQFKDMEDREVALVSGIGDPRAFEETISRLGIPVGLKFSFSDHHHYSSQEIDDIVARCRKKGITTVITTEKDASRLSGFTAVNNDVRFLVLAVRIEIVKDEESFINRLYKLYSA